MSEETEKYTINLKEGQDTLVIRQGEALPQHEPEIISIEGTIDAPLGYATVRKDQLSPAKSSLIVNTTKRTISLFADDTNHFGAHIKGKLEGNPDLNAFAINQEKYYSSTDLIKLLKIRRVFFANRDENTKIVKKLMDLEVKSSNLIIDSKDNKGNINKQIQRKMESELDLSFKLNIPLFKGGAKHSFFVEVCMDVSDQSIRFWLESAELMELLHDQAEHILSEQVTEITNLVELPVLYQ